MWIRLHIVPKLCRNTDREFFTPKQIYYFDRSFERYLKTDDGKYFATMGNNLIPEIGKIENVRFIISSNIPLGFCEINERSIKINLEGN